MTDYERLGVFYLGRLWDEAKNAPKDDLLLYDSRDLTTHAVCVGMTGSGKTGLCLSLLEEAALDGVPAIAIDPKGDLSNLCLTFPSLAAAAFRPWIDEAEAARKQLSPDAYAASVADSWRKGLADWGQDGARIARFRAAVDVAVYTPGSSAGLQLSLLDSLAPPPAALAGDDDARRQRLVSTVSGLMALLGIDSDPVRGREHILLSNLLDRAWQQGKSLALADLIREVQTPPFDRVGVLDLESFYPAKARADLAAALNGFLASPGFGAWTKGEPLDVQRLLWTAEGKPRLSILSIAHLGDAERMFFVTVLLSEVVSWMRAQAGTPSLRAILYMDEVFGFFPPTANPPSKLPMLTLLKQARAFGLGIVLATQNPVDLDYKGLSNAGTWFLGRLQTERDKKRVIEGLEGSASARSGFDRERIEATLAGLANRVFLMNNVHDDTPVLFQSRWALSYLRGPLTNVQIRTLTEARDRASRGSVAPVPPQPPVQGINEVARGEATAANRSGGPGSASEGSGRPAIPPEAGETFVAPASDPAAAPVAYRPCLLGRARLHFVSAKVGIDVWEDVAVLAPLGNNDPDAPWSAAEAVEGGALSGEPEPRAGARFGALPSAAQRAKSYSAWSRSLADNLYRTRTRTLFRYPALRMLSAVGESEGDFRARVSQQAREARDRGVDALRKKYAPKVASLQERIRRAEERVARERSQYDQQKVQTAVSFGATILGAVFGRKAIGVGGIGRATTAARGVGRSMKEREDLGTAQENVEAIRQQLADLESELNAATAAIPTVEAAASLVLDRTEVRPRKSDIGVPTVVLAWVPEVERG